MFSVVLRVVSLSVLLFIRNMAKELIILHFNDVYNVEPQKMEPAGGAARMAHYVHSLEDQKPLVLFSGDALNPSLSEASSGSVTNIDIYLCIEIRHLSIIKILFSLHLYNYLCLKTMNC